jgi:hypothetical protein
MTFLMAGVAPEQVNAACEAMHAQVEKMASGDFSDQLLKRALQMTETSIRSSGDDLGSMLQRQIAGMAHGRTLGTADMLSMLTGIGREDIRQIAACLKPSGIIFSTGPLWTGHMATTVRRIKMTANIMTDYQMYPRNFTRFSLLIL